MTLLRRRPDRRQRALQPGHVRLHGFRRERSRAANTTRFGNLRFYLAYQNMVGQPPAVTEFTAYNNGGNGANAYIYKGTNDGANHYTVDIPLPADTATAVAQGRRASSAPARSRSRSCRSKSALDPRPPVTPTAADQRRRAAHLRRRRPVGPAAIRGARSSPTRSATSATARSERPRARTRWPTPSTAAARNTVEACVALPRPESRLVDGHDQRPGAERELLVQAHDPRHPRQRRSAPIRSRTATTSSARSTRPASCTLDGLIAASSVVDCRRRPARSAALLDRRSVPAGTALGASGSAT